MSDPMFFWTHGPWITRDMKRCVLADEYEKLLKHCEALERAGDVIAHELTYTGHKAELQPWWDLAKRRGGHCYVCSGEPVGNE